MAKRATLKVAKRDASGSHAMVLQLISHSLGWLSAQVSAKAQDALIAVLASGPVPQHVAFILDGNRRYARSKHKQIKQGHTDGFYTLRKVCSFSHLC